MNKNKPTGKRALNVYANLSHKRKTNQDLKARRKAEYLATLPKHPAKRLLYRMHPKRVLGYWFSKQGALTLLKIVSVIVVLIVVAIGSLFAYYRRDIDQIRPSELAKRVQTTITRYYDRNNQLLWEDRGDGNYKQVVKADEISKHVKNATIAIEDRNFYKHRGISLSGLIRATVNNAGGGGTQGGSTLTQQLIKQVFLADDANKRGFDGIPRKIKEVILSIEVERMYNKDQILALYLNESPYGGRRNGVESGSQTYFGKSAKELSVAEAALLASIPNQPGLYDPYNTDGHKALISRQHKTLDTMLELNYISKQEYDEAKAYPILDHIKPLVTSTDNIKAPWFVLEVRKQLERELGKATVGRGGLVVKTTLDSKAQEIAERAVATGAQLLPQYGADNIALSSVDVKTGQIIAMVGSVDYNRPGYGQQNSATSPLEPGSSIKPIVDFAPLFKQRQGKNYTPGTTLSDENIDKLYCAGYTGGNCTLQNYTRRTYGNVSIRDGLAGSLNRPAVKAMNIAGVKESLQTARDLGDINYCQGNNSAGLSAAIGGGCTVSQGQHTNAYASLARGGVYRPLSYMLEVRNSNNEVLKKWDDGAKPKQALDPQAAYMLTSILSDPNARRITFGSQATSFGFVIPGVWTASKTGTTENGQGAAKDSWLMNYSPVVATGVWMGNHDGRPLASSDNTVVRRVSNNYMQEVHPQVYQPTGAWKPNQQIERPAGIRDAYVNGRRDIVPSWYNNNQSSARTYVKMTFDKVSKKKATRCTPTSAKIDLTVTRTTDPISRRQTFIAPDGYDASQDDDVHKCNDAKPSIASIEMQRNGSGSNYTITVTPAEGSHDLERLQVSVDSRVVVDTEINSTSPRQFNTTIEGSNREVTISATVEDETSNTGTSSRKFRI